MKRIALCLALLLPASGCREKIDPATIDGQLRSAWGRISDKNYVRVRGVGVPPDNAQGQTRRRALARESALIAARLEMLRVIKGVHLKGNITVGAAMVRHSQIREIADRLVRGAEEIQTEWIDFDDSCVVTLELRRDRVKKLIEEDKPYEPIPLRERQERLLRFPGMSAVTDRPQAPLGMKRVRHGKSPDTALALGLIFPGLGQVYGGDTGSESGRGLYSMLAVITLVGVGAEIGHDRKTGEVGSNGHEVVKKGNQSAGYALYGLAGAVHLWAAADGRKMADANGSWTLVPDRGGARLSFSKKF